MEDIYCIYLKDIKFKTNCYLISHYKAQKAET